MGSNLTNVDAFDHDSLTAELNATHDLDRDAIWFNMFNSPAFSREFETRDGIQDRELLTNVDLDFEVVPQVDYTAWDPQSDVIKAIPRWLQTHEMKVDFEFVPMKMARTYWGKLYKAAGDQFQLGPYEWLIARTGEVIRKKLMLDALYKGVRDDLGTTTTDSMDGRNKIIADEITAGNLTPVVTGVLTYANTFDSIEAMCVAHDATIGWGDVDAILPVSEQIFNWYWTKRREKFPHLVDAFRAAGIKDMIQIEGFPVVLVKSRGLKGSQRLCITQKQNGNIGGDSKDKQNKMQFQRDKRVVNGFVDFKMGFNFAYLFDGAVTVNDQV